MHSQVLLHHYQGVTGSYDHRIRADMTYFAAPNNGAVFSCSSIAFGQALPVNNFENNVSRLLANVVNTFIKPEALPDAVATTAMGRKSKVFRPSLQEAAEVDAKRGSDDGRERDGDERSG